MVSNQAAFALNGAHRALMGGGGRVVFNPQRDLPTLWQWSRTLEFLMDGYALSAYRLLAHARRAGFGLASAYRAPGLWLLASIAPPDL